MTTQALNSMSEGWTLNDREQIQLGFFFFFFNWYLKFIAQPDDYDSDLEFIHIYSFFENVFKTIYTFSYKKLYGIVERYIDKKGFPGGTSGKEPIC